MEKEREYLYAGQVAELFHVSPKTIARWSKEGLLKDVRIVRTLGGHRRFKSADINQLLEMQLAKGDLAN